MSRVAFTPTQAQAIGDLLITNLVGDNVVFDTVNGSRTLIVLGEKTKYEVGGRGKVTQL